MPAPIIAYIRVSTDKQGKSGLGLEAQRDAIARFAATESLETAGSLSRSNPEKERTPWTSAHNSPLRCARPSRSRHPSLSRSSTG
jgi:hypothetical protein